MRPPEAARRDWLLVGVAWAALVLTLAVWLARDRRPPEWDHANHLERAVLCARDLGAGAWRAVLERSSFYPPIVPCAAGLLYRLAPTDLAAAQTVILLFLGLGMAATYVLGRELASSTAGVAAAWIFGSAPFVIFTALRFQLDLPLAAMVALALVALVRTEGFTRGGASLAAGLVFGAGLLVKPTFAVYVAGPVLWLLARERRWRAVRHCALMVLIAGALSLPWYGPRLFGLPLQLANRAIKNAALDHGRDAPCRGAELGGAHDGEHRERRRAGARAQGRRLPDGHAGQDRRRGKQRQRVPEILVPHQDDGEQRREERRQREAAAPQHGDDEADEEQRHREEAELRDERRRVEGERLRRERLRLALEVPGLGVPTVLGSTPSEADWRHREVLRAIATDSGGRPATVSVVPNHAFFSVSNFRYYALRDGLSLRFTRAWDGEPIGIHYVVLKSGAIGPPWTAEKIERTTARFTRQPALARVYPVIADFQLPDGSTATVRARRVPEGVAAAPARLAEALEAAIRRQLDTVARDVDNLEIRMEYEADIVRGRVRRIDLTADSARIAEYRRPDAAVLRVRRLALAAEDVLVNPFSLEADGRAELLDVGRLRLLRAEIAGDDLQAFIGGLKAFRRARVRLAPEAVYFTARQPGFDVWALVKVRPGTDAPFRLEAERVAVGWIPVPAALVNWVVRHYDPTPRLRSRLPFPVEIGRVTVTEQALRIGD